MAVSIPEGYGAWGDLNTFSFSTTTTYSCHGIAAWHAGSRMGGIYHVGSGNWNDERLAFEMMMSSLQPDNCVISQGAWVAPGPILGGLPNPIDAESRANILAESADIDRVCQMYCALANVLLAGPLDGLRLEWTLGAGYQLQANVGGAFDVTTHGNFNFHYVRAGARVGSNAQGFYRSA